MNKLQAFAAMFVTLGAFAFPAQARAQSCVPPTLDVVTEVRETSPLTVVMHVEVPACVDGGPGWTVLRCTDALGCVPVVAQHSEADPWRTWFNASRQGLYLVSVFWHGSDGYAVVGLAGFAQFRRGPRTEAPNARRHR